mmetsp:Transcript_37024/g.77568  ORF Transcript_37024/g.77568 Transcript_37024/m.77568 type:complete len:87 (-) Transcript_37024:116-376(-)
MGGGGYPSDNKTDSDEEDNIGEDNKALASDGITITPKKKFKLLSKYTTSLPPSLIRPSLRFTLQEIQIEKSSLQLDLGDFPLLTSC